MILASTHQRLTRGDAQLLVRLLAHDAANEREQLEDRLREQGIDGLLDDERLPSLLVRHAHGGGASLELFFYVMVRHALLRVGVTDRGLADYVTAVLVHFGARGRATRIDENDDQVYDALAGLLGDVNDRDAKRAFLVRAHLGNYALWLSGLYPDLIEHRRWRRGGPDIDYYDEMGRRGFLLASDHQMATQNGVAELYAAAASRFTLLRAALNEVSDTLLFPHVTSPERLMRQVRTSFGVLRAG